jgi:RHH-type proline utilization regulon transcriptional repressor/proline dehydrogenase/delta 1-pyrroline-5-carboxylate dehydrogenase
LPRDLYGVERKNSMGVDLSNENVLRDIGAALERFGVQQWHASPLLAAPSDLTGQTLAVVSPADRRDIVGQVIEANDVDVDNALANASVCFDDWQATQPQQRADILTRASDLLESHQYELMALAIREAGKSLPNAIAEVREAIDFLRYYAAQVRREPHAPALGPVVCISPWNFPLAIFIGEVSAALAAGNVVLAKPAEQTPLIAHRAVQLLHEAGVPRAALQFLPGRGEVVGARLTADPRVRGVIFTGSTEVAQMINRTLAARAVAESRETVLIAETGGQNAMIVDSSALPEQVVQDIVLSAFDSAGQRCSALRVLCLQADIADKTLTMLEGAMQELRIGNPDRLSADIGPVIDADAQRNLLDHIEHMKSRTPRWFQLPLPSECDQGTFVAPTVIEIESLSELTREVFGPVLHVIRFRREELPQLVDAINATGYGLTLGVHSRIDETIDFITSHAHVGNVYVNRNIVGAVVGVQPFGGEGKSGTGPKAGGPLYLKRLQKNPAVARSAHTIRENDRPTATRAAFDSLLAWAKTHGHERIAMLGEHYARDTPLNATELLPGPTGERNTLAFAPRGNVLCSAAETDALLNQLAAAFATGNTAVACPRTAALIPAGLPKAVRDAIRCLDRIDDDGIEIHAALVQAQNAPELLPLLAARNGALVPVIEAGKESAVPLWRLVAERAVCVNTTAAGGNASLMMLES